VSLIAALPHDNGAGDCPTPHRAPPGEESESPYDIQLVLVQKITTALGKINKNCCHQSCTF